LKDKESRLWAAIMLARSVRTCESILRKLPVRAGGLDPLVLRRAMRGAELPPADTYIVVTGQMLDAIDEAGPLARRT
jgi:hypothetical protein